jgi:hypothetical protein
MLMQNSNDAHSLTIGKKINGIGESTHQYAPKIFETKLIRQWIICSSRDRSV